jgi:hypothetical protein
MHVVSFMTKRTRPKRRVKFKAKGPAPRAKGKHHPTGYCKRVKMGRNRKCSIELCKTGRGKTGWKFKKGTKRCSR